MTEKLVLPTPPVRYDPAVEAQRNLLIERAVQRASNTGGTTPTGTAWGDITGTLSDQTDLQAALDGKQAADAQLDSLAALGYTGNALKLVRVNAGETAFELTTVETPATLGPADVWVYEHFGNLSANSLFAGTAISGGSNNTSPPAASLLGYNFGGVYLTSAGAGNSGYRYSTSFLTTHIFGGGARKFRGHYSPQDSFAGRVVRMGFLDTTSTADAADGAYFEIDGSTCRAKTANNSTRTTAGTTLTLTLASVYTFDIDVNADGTSARFRVYAGTSSTPALDQTITTNIPTSTARAFGVGCNAASSDTSTTGIGVLYGMGFGTPAAFSRVMGPT
ncbi:MAG: hypothetical protein ACK5NX_01290 [Armatimonadota bacterium]